MSIDSRPAKWESRVAELFATDAQFAAAQRDDSVFDRIGSSLSLSEVLQVMLDGYAERPALGRRAVEYERDPRTDRVRVRYLPRFDTITYWQLRKHISSVVTALTGPKVSVRPGDTVCVLGFTSVDYTIIDLALMRMRTIAVPLHTSAPAAALRPIVEETEPVVIACSVDHLTDAVALIETHRPAMLLVFDYHPEVDDHRDAVVDARDRLARLGAPTMIETLTEMIAYPAELLPPPVVDEPDPLSLILYTSGSTGTPKGAMYSESLIANIWRRGPNKAMPVISMNFMPLSHMFGRGTLYSTLAQGGIAYFTAQSDLSTFLEDLELARPTRLNFVPRIWDMLFQQFQARLARREAGGGDPAVAEAEVLAELRQGLLGGRFIEASTASAPISAELRSWVESLVELPLREAYGATEVRAVTINGYVQRPPVIDYKLIDVPELGYFGTDRPYPRGELYVKSSDAVRGYYKRPELTAQLFDAEGWYHTGDIMVELGPDRLQYVDRRNNVLKLAQGEFVAVSKLETVFGNSPLVRQIFLYANSARPYLLAVVVPSEQVLADNSVESLKPAVAESLRCAAREAALQSYEIPRDIVIETEPFSLQNGLLTGIGKLAWPKLKEHYGPTLEQLYSDLAASEADDLAELRREGAARPVIETVGRAAGALLGVSDAVRPEAHFADLGGDSLSALTFSNLLHDIYGVEVPVGVIVSPAGDLATIAAHIESLRRQGPGRPTFASVHGRDAAEVSAADLRLETFIDAQTLRSASSLSGPAHEVRTVLLTGATGFLGRYLALEWLERMNAVGGKVICLVRGKTDADARTRLDATFDSGDTGLVAHFGKLAEDTLEVLAGDKAEPDLGLGRESWQRLAETVDLIVDPAALVNHMLPYSQLFGPNVGGTAELIRLAITTRIKPFVYISTVGVGTQIDPAEFTEDADIRIASPVRKIDDTYANGYANSKWGGEVLLRAAHDLCDLPVTVFRSNMILAEPAYAGQLNVPDMFTRMMLSLAQTGIAPGSFYQLDANGQRQRAHYDGLAVDFIAEAIAVLGGGHDGYRTYHVMNPHDDGIGLDEYVDWLVDAGCPIQRIGDYEDWRQRFEAALRGLPEEQRQNSLLPLMPAFRRPLVPTRGELASVERFQAAVREAKIGPDKDIPQITAPIIAKYVADLKLLGLL
ncbi:thioester reductase domain-containing protein [Nocardia sp. CA2R105]|uniref:carboxylic acid reductase n=1 Tax=Nocardia coffeae TaxID=2873381 RepID=UPI001CA7ABF3|nr:carboxylic acid reductase [Nocardia coffeae]MBY8862941.1 thioester reductase domain-containing protein [Nocardia coffeae]